MGATVPCDTHVLCRIEHQPFPQEPEVPANPLKTIGIACVLFSLMAVLLFKIQTQMMNSAGAVSKNQIKQRPTEIQHNVVAPRVPARPLDTNSDVQTSDFYRTIIDNNLFRPLGWRPPRPTEPYRLIGTIIRTDEKIGAQAILQTTHGNTTYTVTRGDTLDANTTVIDIQAKQVTLEKAGEQRTLKLNTTPWLK